VSDSLETLLRENLRIVLVRPQHPGNVGAVARAMKNMGLRKLVIVDPPVLDLERARWMATSGRDVLAAARFTATVAEAVDDCDWAVACTARSRRWRWPVVDQAELARQAFDTSDGGPPRRTAVLFGQEDFGLDNEALSHCQTIVQIPTDGLASLNLSQAVLLICARLFDEARARGWEPTEASRQGRRSGGPTDDRAGESPRKASTPPVKRMASLGEQSQIVDLALETLALTPYMNGKTRDQVQVLISGLLQRSQPTSPELNILRGMLKKTRWRIENPDK